MNRVILDHMVRRIVCAFLLAGCLTVVTTLSWAQKTQGADTTSPIAEREISEEEYSQNVKDLMRYLDGRSSSYVYQRENRSDPFRPFIREKFVDQEVETGSAQQLVGMQRFEPGQLALVAVVQTVKGPIAMVQDSTGKGYMVSPGVKIGKSGVIDEISMNMILVRQQYTMTSGAVRHRVVKMTMKREGE